MKQSAFNFRQTTVRFFGPLVKHKILTLSASFIIGISLFLIVDVGLAEVVRQNSYNISMLSIEMLNELGPNLTKESKTHAEMIERYIDHMEQRKYATILRILYPEYNPKKALADAIEDLVKVTEEEKAGETIWQAGVISNEFFEVGTRFPRSPYKWFESEDVPDQLLKDLDNEFVKFHELVEQFEKAQTMEDVVQGSKDTCGSSRRAFLLLSLARLGYDDEEKMTNFLVDVKRARNLALRFSKMREYNSQQTDLQNRARNIGLRADIVNAMLKNDMESACEILKKATKEALKEKGNSTE